MKNAILFFICVLLTHFNLNAQVIWQHTIGGNGYDFLDEVINTSDGGYLLVGESDSGISGDKTESNWGDSDFWIVKTNAIGEVLWNKTLGGLDEDRPYSAIETQDGGFVIAGTSFSNSSGDKTENSKGEADFWIVKLNSTGTKLWDKTIGGIGYDEAFALQGTSTGDILLGGVSDSNISGDKTENSKGGSDIWIVKINSSGTVLWDKTFGGNDDDFFEFLKFTPDGGYLLGADSDSGMSGDKTDALFGKEDYWILKVSSTNTIEWQRNFGGSSSSTSNATDGIVTLDGGYLIAGSSDSGIGGNKTLANKGADDLWLIKLNSLGVEQWQKDMGGSEDEFVPFVIQKANGNYVIASSSYSDISGNKSENSYNGSEDLWLIELDANGTLIADKTIGTNAQEEAVKILLASDGNYVIGGFRQIISSDFWFLKVSQNTLNTAKISENLNLEIFPVPAINELNISSQKPIDKIEILDINGREIIKIKNLTDKIDVSKVSSGIYLMRLFSENSFVIKRFIKH